MNRLQKFAIAIVITLGVGMMFMGAHAQQTAQEPPAKAVGNLPNGAVMQDAMMARLKERLNLTPEQETQIQPILQEAIQGQLALIPEHRNRVLQWLYARKNNQQTMWQDMEQKLAPILTDAQKQEFQKMREERVGQMEAKGQGMFQTMGQFRQLFQELNLSDEQKKQLFEIFMNNQNDRDTVMNDVLKIQTDVSNMILTEAFNEEKVRQMFRESTAKMEDFVVSRAKIVYEMKAVLTPQQVEILKQRTPELLTGIQEQMHARDASRSGWFGHRGK